MKLLGWMQRKLRQNNGDVFKDFQTGTTCNRLSGGPSLDDCHQLSSIHSPRIQCSRPIKNRHVFATDEVLLFEGLLSIGTLGSTPIQEDQGQDQFEYQDQEDEEKQYFAIALETIAEKEEMGAASETDLMAVNTDLEKLLTEAAEKEGDRLSSARPSHVNGKANEACPLQEFLFGAVTEVAAMVEKEKVKVKRASLGELFMIEDGRKGEEKGKKKGVEAIKKKKRMMKRSESHKARGGDNGHNSGYAKDAVKTAKFQKILQIFHKKIHPENEMAPEKSTKSSKYKNKYTGGGICSGNNYSVGDGGNPLMASSKRSCSELSFSLDGSDSTSSGEHWIKTDADYLVLELQNGTTCTKDYPKEVLVH